MNDEPSPAAGAGRNHLHPTLAVNRNGVVGVGWYDRRDAADDLGWTVRFTASLDGGETFLPSVVVSEQPEQVHATDPIFTSAAATRDKSFIDVTIRSLGFQFGGGDWAGLTTSANGDFHPYWVDNRTGVLQAWTAPVHVEGRAAKHGDEQLAALDDLTSTVGLEVTDSDFDPATGSTTFKAALYNQGTAPACKPLVVRAVSLSSVTGTPRAVNADNGASGQGATWTFDDRISTPCLGTGQRSQPRELRFGVADLPTKKEEIGPRGARGGFVSLRVQVLGKNAR
jgi:hypothetical protein